MLNIILIICEVIVAYIAMILLYKKYKTDGLITYTIIATIISNLMCLKKNRYVKYRTTLRFRHNNVYINSNKHNNTK